MLCCCYAVAMCNMHHNALNLIFCTVSHILHWPQSLEGYTWQKIKCHVAQVCSKNNYNIGLSSSLLSAWTVLGHNHWLEACQSWERLFFSRVWGGLLELLCSFAFGVGCFAAVALRRECSCNVRGVGLLYSCSIERGAQRFVSQAIRRANDNNLERSDTCVFEQRCKRSCD